MIDVTEVRADLAIVLEAIQRDRTLLSRYWKTTGQGNQMITVENLEDLAGNHLFDDHPEWFGIEKMGAHRIRAYFQMGVDDHNFLLELYKEFPDILEGERTRYLERINDYRERIGLAPIFFVPKV
ncbi:hypothetical protein HYV82_01305 [Candidatus Woesearchaeota archaeon]|nr:hypothetical protein [Candidatus Woesearchaeota archaeon]